jgi:hypothetical protein
MAGSFRALVESVRRSDAPARNPVAFVNGSAAAPFADACIVLPDFIIFIQEEQRAAARLAAGHAGTAAALAAGLEDSAATPSELSGTSADLSLNPSVASAAPTDVSNKPCELPIKLPELPEASYGLLGSYATSQPHVFLYIADGDAPATGAAGANRCVVARGGHERLLGALCTHLRASSRELDDADARATVG